MKLAIALLLVVSCGGGSRPAPAPATAPVASPSPPPPPPPAPPPAAAGVVTPTMHTCVGAACAGQQSLHKLWHRHGFVEKQSVCFECWDEQSDDCETAAVGASGYLFVGSSCGSVPAAP